MPNWTYNEVVFENHETLMKYVTDGNFDFNKVIPMPKELERTIGGGIIKECIDLYNINNMKLEDFKKNMASYTAINSKVKTKKGFIEILTKRIGDNPVMFNDEEHWYPREEGELGVKRIPENYGHTGYEIGEYYTNLIKKYGCYDWYVWSIDNWGVKWNASDTNITDNIASFYTPWGIPDKVYEKICEDNPNEKISFYGQYEDDGEFTYYNHHGILSF